MINYTNNFPIVPETPETPRLQPQYYTTGNQFLMAYQGAPNYVDIARMHEPGFWGPQPNTQKDTYNNLYALSQAESISTGSAQGYAQKIAEYLGMGPNEFQDYSLGAFQRGILMGQKDDPLAPVEFGASQLTPEVQDNLRSILSKLLPIAKQEPQDPENPTPTQKRVNAMMYQLAYAKASEVTKTDLGFSVVDAFRSQAEVYGKILNAYTYGAAGALYDGYNAAYNPTKNTKIARGIDDILKIRNRVDLTFDPAMWWRNLDPTVQQGFIENGISPSTIRTALNEDEANFRIGEIIFKGDTQKRIEAYAPGYLDSGRLIRDNLIGGIINSSDTVPFIALELGATVLTGGVGSLVATAAAAPTTGLTVFRAARNVASTIAKLPLGISPTYAKNLGLIGGSTLTGAIFGVGAALQETTRQEKQIAYANALVFADPEMQKDYDLSSIGWAGGEGFAIGFLGFGVLPQVVGSTAGAFLNKLKGVNVAPLGESVVRMTGDKRFTYEGTSVGEALGFYKGKLSRKDVAVDLPLHEKIITEAELEGVKPSAQQLSNETQTAVNRADARAAVTPDAARATPDVPMTRRLDNETRQAYAERTGANGTLSNIIEFVTEVSRKNSAGDAVKERASLSGTGDTFGDMGTTDRLRILYASEEHLNTTRLKEKEAGKLTPAREKAYAIMESQRRSMIKQYTKSLSKPERKALSDSLGGVKKPVKTITEHVADARSTVISSAAKNEAAEKAAVSLLGTAREIVANPTRKAELRADLPKEVLDILDAAITEVAITGTVSPSTVEALKADISGVARKPSNRLTDSIKEALKIKKLNPKRTALINALKEDLSKFSSLVSGNKDNADRFYQFTNDLVDGGYINAIDQSILLASVVHLNFDSKVFGLKFEIDSIVNKKTGKIEYTTVGAFNDVTKAITINSSWIGNSSERRVMTVLHEIGHAYFQSSATSDIYLDTLKMYNSLTRNYGPSLLNLNVAKITDPLLSSGYLTEYHLQNMEEVFVHTFSQVLFSEAQLAVAQMAPLEVSSFRSILNDMKKGIILAASMFDSSDHYAVANNLITRITEIDMVASRAISVPDLAEAMAQAAKNKTDNFTYNSFNSVVRDWMIKNKPNYAQSVVEKAKLTKDEFKLLFEIRQDPSLIVAMAILKSNGRQAIDAQGNLTVYMKDLVNAYTSYKQTQFGSMLVKTAWLLTTQEYKQMGGMNKRRRLGFIQEKLFDIETKEFKQGSYATPMLPATYEDRHLALVESTNYLDPNKNPIVYAFNFWGTRADSLIAVLNNPNKLNETVANKKNILSDTDRLALIEQAITDPYLNKPLIRTLQEYYNNNGFADIANLVTLVHHKNYIDTLKSEGVFDVDVPLWSSKEVAIDSIATFLSNKDITHLSVPTLLQNINPVLIQKLLDSPDMTPEKALTGIYKMIETEAIVLNKTSGKWELPSSAKPKKKKVTTKTLAEKTKEVKVKEEAKLAALEDYSEELTLDNIEEVFSKFSHFKTLTEEQINNLYDKLPYIKSKIESGGLKTEKDLLKLAVTINQNIVLDDIRKARRAGSLETEEGITQEGAAPTTVAGKFVPPTEKQYRAVIFENALLWNSLTNNTLLTEKEILLAKGLLVVESDDALSAKALELLGQVRSPSAIRADRTALRKKMATIAQAIKYEPTDTSVSIQDSLLAYVKQTQQTVDKAVAKPTPVKAVVKQAEDAPASKPVSNPVDAGSRLLENQALAAKLKKKDPAPVITPVTKVEEGTLFRATSEVTGNVPEAVLRPEKQVDAIIENSEVSTKEAVSFVPKKPLVMTMTAAEFMANEVKMASTMKVADRMGVDALVFSDGVVMPVQADAPVVVKGVTETKIKPGVPSVTKIKVKKGVPVQTVTAAVELPKVEVVEPTTTPAPAVAPVEDLPSTPVPIAASEGAPVRVTKTGGIAPPAPRKTVSDVVKTTETERIERVVNDDKDLLRDNGMDQGFLKLFLKNYWTRMQNIDKATDTYSPMLLSLWTKFVTINKAIVEANRAVFGDDGVAKFWITVDKLRAENIQKLGTVPGYKPVSERQLMVLAAKEVGDAYMPPILLDELNIVKSSEDATAFTLVAKESKTPRKKVSDATKAESPVPTPPEPTPAPAPKAGDEVGVPEKLDLPIEPIKETPRGDMGRMIDAGVSNSAEGASVLLRQGSLIGAIFGGSERSSRNWWRAMMSWMANSSQAASQTGKTIRNLQKDIRFLSRWFEDNRAQSGHLVGAGKEAFRTARQCKSDEARMITRIARQQLLLNKKLKDSGLALDKVRAVGVLSYTKLSEGTIIAPADLVALGLSPDLAKSIAVEANSLLQITRQTNQTILGLQNETGLFNSNAADGTPFDPMKYAPVQLNHESFSAMSPTDRALFVAGLVKARRTRKLKSPILDINTLIVLGWLDVAPSKEARGTALFAGKRDFRPGESTQSFSPETLAGLKISEHPITVGEKGVLATLANGSDSQNYFVLTNDKSGVITLYRMPKVISELADADRVRYIEAVNGNKSLYTQRWQDYLKGRELIEVEMNEMLDYKTKKGAYSEYQRNTGTNIDRPLMVVDQAAETALAVPGLIPEEVLSDPVILKHIRTNLAESYNYFMNGRVFELIFQRELDRLMGTRNVRITDVFPHIASKSRQNIEAIARAENWTPGQLAARLQDVTEGIQRLKDEYASNADTLPMLPYQDQAAARSLLALMKVKVATGYFLGALPELMMETLKSNPLHLPGNLISALRFVVGDFRVSKNSLMNNSELGDMIFGLENIKYEFSSRFLGEANQGAFELDSTIGSKIKSKFINPRPATGLVDRGVRVLESGARVAETIGSLQAITNITRSMAKVRLQRMIYGHIKKGRIQKLLVALEDPAMMKLMQDYMAAAETSAGAENQLRKQFYTLARKTGFGFNPKEALVFMKYGLNSVEKIKHLEYLIKKVDKKGEGRVNLHNMVDVYWHATTHPVDGIKPEVLEQAISSYGLALEDLVVKTSSPEPIGLGRVTSIDSKTPLGKLWYALSSYIRGFQDNVIMDYGSRDTLRYLAANIVLYGTLDATIGLLREWIAGRDGEDILEEFSDNPHAFAVRVAKSAPIMGMWSGALEAGLSGLSYMSGGTWKYYGSPMQSIGMGAATGAVESIGRGVSEVVEGVTGDEEVDYMKVAKGVGDITSVNSLLNRSPIAVAARSLEVSGALEEKGTLQTYMNMIHKNPHPYAKSQGRKQSSSQSLPPIPKVAPRNFELEAQALKKARAAQAGVRYEDMSKGVSGSLGDLLDNAQ